MISTASEFLVEMQGITKRFPGVLALDKVDFQLKPGEVHVLLGENGAGKSTLIKVLSGAHLADEGRIQIEGQAVGISSPHSMLEKGLRFIYQEVNLVQEIDIARNMFLGMEPIKSRFLGIIDQKTLYKRAEYYLEKFHVNLNPYCLVGDLSVTQQKMVEIARALVTDAKALILDEPTDVLEDSSRNELFDVIRKLKTEQNMGFIYISHRYQEVFELGDRVTILRDGQNVGTYLLKELTLDDMVEKMIGGQINRKFPNLPEPMKAEALKVKNLVSGDLLSHISLTVRKGEVLGITGLMGAGKTELGRALGGIDRVDSGEIYIHGHSVPFSDPATMIQCGIAYLTEDRKSEGVILDQSIRDNYGLPNIVRLSSKGIVQYKEIDREIDDLMDKLAIKAPGRHTLVGQLSGGNQQKVVLAKWLGAQCKILIFDEPTRGIDIRGRLEVYRIMKELLEQGVAILMLTSDYSEALSMSHRVAVLHHGSIRKIFKRGEAMEDDILRVAIGATA